MTVSELRQAFLDYFASKGHTIVPSSPLVPANDPTLLFTNAGMVQFKDTFLGLESRNYTRATTCQRCVRAGGKHNDLENVGYTARHHTFFEMLGNFSFGDYFKRDAIQFAWEFLTEVIKLPPEKLWITVYQQDDEAANIWLKEIKIDPTRFSRCGEDDNFWSMGDTGPCGPCSEIFYDHGSEIAGGPPGTPEADGDRYIEIWNLVFMQFNRDSQGNITPLPKPSVDTGMGLERLATILQNVHNNYDIDLFQNIIKDIATLANCNDLTNNSLRVIADHIRACSFLIIDGIVPANEGRGYVLRRIIRRAIRHGHKLGLREVFFYNLVGFLEQQMGAVYPELSKNQELVAHILKQEEERFADTLDRGMGLLEQEITNLTDKTLSGQLVFKLYDTYGFPTDLTADIARERNLQVDMVGFEAEMAQQRSRSSTASQFDLDMSQTTQDIELESEFIGYEHISSYSLVTAIFHAGKLVEKLDAGQDGQIVLQQTPFYAESGGQVGDQGQIFARNSMFIVNDTKKMGQANVHIGKMSSGSIKIGEQLLTQINTQFRLATARNHTATHLLHAALRQVLGEHVKQRGSLVAMARLRFDFSHFEPVTNEQLLQIERIVNQQILLNTPVQTEVMDLETAMNSGATALFGEKYSQQVRVLSIGKFSTELCGGTHVKRIGDIGLFKIVTETGIAAGVRRIEAITGEKALDWITNIEITLQNISNNLKTNLESVEERIIQILEQNRSLEKELSRLQAKLANSQGSDLVNQAIEIKGIKLLATSIDNVDMKQLRTIADQIKSKLVTGVILLAGIKDNRISLVAAVTADLTSKIKAGDLMKYIAIQVGGKGGGRPDMAQGGGSELDKLPATLQSVTAWVTERL
ncbi:MAG TPA: alanine--tRNA ligase [Thioploca sp.]|nr:alanine--tRNA ligase [Thioploca sp.]